MRAPREASIFRRRYCSEIERLSRYRGGRRDETLDSLFARLQKQIGAQILEEDVLGDDEEIENEEWRPDELLLSQLLKDGAALARSPAANAKWSAVVDIIDAAQDERVLLFAQPVETVTVVAEFLEKHYGQRPSIIIGNQSDEERRLEVNEFQRDGGRRFLVSSRAGGEGLNMQRARRLIHLEVKSAVGLPGRLKVSVVTGDVRQMHQSPGNAGALFQVASQFNLLEMVSPTVTPEHGVTRYQNDQTQGPACAIAAGAATIYRNYFAPVNGRDGQTAERQYDGLANLGEALGKALNQPVKALWSMQNGYALCTRAGLDAIAEHLGALQPEQIDILRGKLLIGIHRDVEVTDAQGEHRPLVSQAFCSALPVAYIKNVPRPHWEAFASLVLQAAYEATMWAAVLNAQRGASNLVLLTQLGGGAFGNDDKWIHAAMQRALEMMSGFELDVRLVSYGTPSRAILQMAHGLF